MKNGSNIPHPARGFTLVEVVMALAIIAFAMFSVAQVVSSQVGGAAYMKQKTIAHWVGQNLLTELQIMNAFPPTGRRSGTVEMAGAEWDWEYDSKTTQDEKIRRVDLDVRLADEEQILSSLTGFLGKPSITR